MAVQVGVYTYSFEYNTGNPVYAKEAVKMDNVADEVITLSEAVKLIGANQEVMRRAAECGELPAKKVRRVWVTTKSALLEWDKNRIKKS